MLRTCYFNVHANFCHDHLEGHFDKDPTRRRKVPTGDMLVRK